SKSPMFNYATFCKLLSVDEVNYNIWQLFKKQKSISVQKLDDNIVKIVLQEIFKFLMSQISSLRKMRLKFFELSLLRQNITFTSYPGARDCLKDLSELYCHSDIRPEYFYQLSQICNTIQT